MRAHASAEVDPRDDVAPLVGAAHLQVALVAPRQLDEVVGLQQHVVELDERQLLLALEAHLRRIHRQHPVDREVPADVAQEFDVVERRQPLGVVGHDGVAARLAEIQELREDRLDAVLVRVDLLDRENAPRLVAARGIADPRRAAAHQRDGAASPALLQPVQHHDRQQVADVQRRRGAVVADVADDVALLRERVEPVEIRALVDEAALGQYVEEVGLVLGHGGAAFGWFGAGMCLKTGDSVRANCTGRRAMGKIRRALGLMSGTSMDGIDIALIETDGENLVRRVAAGGVAYEPAFRERIRGALRDAQSI